MFKTYFSDTQILLLLTGVFFIALSILFHIRNKYYISIALLFFGALAIHFFAGLLDPFLNLWDERFHALAAKNMLKHPFKPMLYIDPVVNMAYDRWDRFHIWLHKPPVFLWQIAISFKPFGYSELALRLPNIILSSILVLFAYRIGKLLVNDRVGFYTAFLTATSFYIIQLVSGQEGMDHNDMAFTFYVSASIWAWIEYSYSPKKYWIILIGLFSGLAILNKWLTGLIVYAAWGISILIRDKKLFDIKIFKDIFLSFIITCVIFIPWQVYIMYRFPAEASATYELFRQHISTVLDGHEGSAWFHLERLASTYGKIVPYVLLPGFIVLYKKINRLEMKISVIAIPLIVYSFFAFAKTKIPSHVFFVSLILSLALAALIFEFIEVLRKYIKSKKFAYVLEFIILFLIGFANLNIEELQAKHTEWNINKQHIQMLSHNKKVFLSLKNNLAKNSVLFNVYGRHYIEAMYYTDYPAYNFVPSYEQYEDLKKKGRTIALFKTEEIPEYLKNDSTVIIIDEQIQGYE